MELEIRPANRKDAEAVKDFFEHLSEDSRWLRYHSAQPIIKPWMVDAVVATDHERHEALIALHDGRIVGVAEWGRVEPGDTVADVAVVVDETFRRRGVAKALMRALTDNGRKHGIERFAASVLTVNRPTIAMLQRIAPVRETSFDGPTLQVLVPLAPSA